MRAMVVRRYGPPEVFKQSEVPEPALAAGQALIRVKAIGINFADLLARLGVYSNTPKPPFVPGLELAGVVEKVMPGGAGSANVPMLQPGDRVAALTMFKAYAELVAVNLEQAFKIPDAMPFEDAAAIPVNYLTAFHSLFEMGNLRQGDRVLITSAAGGVGVAAVQLARVRGLVTFGTAGAGKQEFLRKIGVDHPIDYTREKTVDVVRRVAPEGIEMALDAIGGKSFADSYRCLGPMGRLVVYGFSTAVGANGRINYLAAAKGFLQTPKFKPLPLLEKNISIIGVHIGRLGKKSAVLRPQLEEIFRLYEAGRVKPVIGKTFPLAEAAAAHRYIHLRQSVGKVLLLP